MAYEASLDMGISEAAILFGVKKLENEKDTFTYEHIAAAIPCSVPTIARHMPKLLEAGKINRTGQKRTGYRYEVVTK